MDAEGEGATLEVSMFPLPGYPGPATWMLVLQERPHTLLVPRAWRALLSPREIELTTAVLRGWDNRLIAGELRISEQTVKRHLSNIFDKLGMPSRAALIRAQPISVAAEDRHAQQNARLAVTFRPSRGIKGGRRRGARWTRIADPGRHRPCSSRPSNQPHPAARTAAPDKERVP